MSIATSQQQTFLRLLGALRGRWRTDPGLPAYLQRLLAAEKRFGSRDRRLYRELVYTTLRYLPWIEPLLDSDPVRAAQIVAWLAADTRDTRAYRAELAGDWPALASLAERAAFLQADAAVLLPAWLREESPETFTPGELETQLARAPLWLRLQTDDPAAVESELSALGCTLQPSPVLASAWRVVGDADLTRTSAYAEGQIEIQDLGSQLLLASVGLVPGGRWLDACAGAGGKSLQLAQLLGPDGTVEAHDIRESALVELKARVARARIRNVRTTPQPAAGTYDGVLVDAPCSGSGTWRRSPHLKWTTTPALVRSRAELQLKLLGRFALCVRPGGLLVYATCSLCRSENAAVVAAFRTAHPAFAPVPPVQTFGFPVAEDSLTIRPPRHDTDGFFVAVFRRAS